MLRQMMHEDFYANSSLTAADIGVSAGWVGHQAGGADCMPVWNERKDIGLLFAGESFADGSDVDRLRAKGHAFDSGSASYVVHLYEEAGEGFVDHLNGIFSGLILDLRAKKALLFNDRFGLGRVYFHETADTCFFASEAKSVLRLHPRLRRLDPRSLGEFFACGCVLQNRSLFPGLSLLPAGSIWTFRPGQPVKKEVYHSHQVWEDAAPLPEPEYFERLKATFARILPRYLAGRQKIAMSLTGGLDSRMIMAWADRPPGALPCYSHGGMIRECEDVRVARQVARLCRQPHRVVTVGGDFLKGFPALARKTVYLTDGCMDVSGATSLYVNRVARDEIAPVRMTGNYGGEVLRGVVMLRPSKLRHPFFKPEFAAEVRQGYATLTNEQSCSPTSFVIRKQVPWHHYSRFSLESSQLTVRSPYLDNELVALAFQAPKDLAVNQRLAARLITHGNPALAAFPTDRGPLGRTGSAGRLREQFQEFTFKADYAYDYGMPQWLVNFDRWLAPLHLERLFLGRHKYYHFRYWYRTALAPFVQEVLLDPRSLARPYFDRAQVERMVNAHVTGRGNYTLEIHALLTSELIHRELLELS